MEEFKNYISHIKGILGLVYLPKCITEVSRDIGGGQR